MTNRLPPPPRKVRQTLLGWLVAFQIATPTLLAAPAVFAAPAWQADLTSPARGSFPAIAPVVLDMEVSWKGMVRAGTLRMEFAPAGVSKAGRVVVRSTASSLGAAAILFPYETHFWSELNPANLRPSFFSAIETDDKEKVDTTVRYTATQAEFREITKSLKTGVVTTDTNTFTFAPVFDMFSAMLLVRSQNLADGDAIVQVVQSFGTPYLLRVKVIGHEVHNARKAIRLKVGLQKINRKSLKLKAYTKLKSDATMWLSDDADRVPIEFRAAAFVGDVRAVLVNQRKP
jgi:hypothetical protein